MRLKEYKFFIYSDLYRITGKFSACNFIRYLFIGEGYEYLFWMRTCAYLYANRFFKYSIFLIARIILNHYSYKLGISIPFRTKIGRGFYIGHFGGIVVNVRSKIGKNCNISHAVTIGESNRGKRKGFPSIGDNVFIGPGARVIGNIKIGNNVSIGANAVVTNDVPDNAVVVGIPGKIISFDGSVSYINRIDY